MLSILVSVLSALALLANLGTVSASRDSLSKHLATDGVVYADEAALKAAFDGPRDYTVMMLMTSESGRVDCGFCRVLGPDFRVVAANYDAQLPAPGDDQKNPRDLFFLVAEPENVLSVFKELGLSHVPNVVVYPPTKSRTEAKQGIRGPHTFLSFMSQGDQQAYLVAQLARFGHDITLHKPVPVSKMIQTAITLAAVAVAGVMFRAQVVRVWQAKQLWLALTLMCVIMFISGHMFNVTRGTQFMSFDGHNLRMFEREFNSQVAAETQVMAVVYAVLAFTAIGLLKFVPRLDSPRAQTIGAVFGAATIYLLYSVLLDIFKLKVGSFPFWLLPFKFV